MVSLNVKYNAFSFVLSRSEGKGPRTILVYLIGGRAWPKLYEKRYFFEGRLERRHKLPKNVYLSVVTTLTIKFHFKLKWDRFFSELNF